jgi:hypothetical protein
VTGDYKDDFTYSFALSGPPKLDEDLTRNLAQAALTACARHAALIGAGEANRPLACREPQVLDQTLERDLQVARHTYPDAR